MDERITDPRRLSVAGMAEHLEAGRRLAVQYSDVLYKRRDLILLNQLARIHGRSLEIRFFGHYGKTFDAAVLQFLPDAQNVAIDCLRSARNLEALNHLSRLKELRLGVHELDDEQHILGKVQLRHLRSLSLDDTRRNRIDLSHLSECEKLECLHLRGQDSGIATLRKLPRLDRLSLTSIKRTCDLAFVSDLRSLRLLTIMLGGRTSIADVTPPGLKALHVVQVLGLQELGDLGRFKKLENVVIEDQIRLKRIRFGRSQKLRSLTVVNCTRLSRLEGLSRVRSLSGIWLARTALDYGSFVSKGVPSGLTRLMFSTGMRKRDAEISADLRARGFREIEDFLKFRFADFT